jgi:N-methylhydantoinase B/oxoprolinase/acetone carboxylase alpha subunit
VNLVPTNDGSLTTGLITVFTDQDATPSVLNFEIFRANNTVATTITALDDGYVGQEILVLFTTSNTTVDFTGTTLKGNAGVNWPAASGDHMTCVFDGANWYCDVSDNTA